MTAQLFVLAQHREMDREHRRRLYDRYVEAKRYADVVETHEAHDHAARAYRTFQRAYLTDPERRCLELEDEIACLAAELAARRDPNDGDAA